MSASDEIVIQRVVRSVRKIIAKSQVGTSDVVAGTVTQVSPLMVRLPGAATPAPAYALHSYVTRTVGDAVLIHSARNELYVAGKLS